MARKPTTGEAAQATAASGPASAPGRARPTRSATDLHEHSARDDDRRAALKKTSHGTAAGSYDEDKEFMKQLPRERQASQLRQMGQTGREEAEAADEGRNRGAKRAERVARRQ